MEAEPIFGWRAYQVKSPAALKGGWLNSDPWTEPKFTATCTYDGVANPTILNNFAMPKYTFAHDIHAQAERHLSKGVCLCGIYMKSDLPSLLAEFDPAADARNYIYAYCKGWGYIAEHRRGMRCQHVEILKLYPANFREVPDLQEPFLSLLGHDFNTEQIIETTRFRNQEAEKERKLNAKQTILTVTYVQQPDGTWKAMGTTN